MLGWVDSSHRTSDKSVGSSSATSPISLNKYMEHTQGELVVVLGHSVLIGWDGKQEVDSGPDTDVLSGPQEPLQGRQNQTFKFLVLVLEDMT